MLIFVNPKTEEINILRRNPKDEIELIELTGTVRFHPPGEIVALADGQ